jgi:hypothetical protein
VVSASAKLSRKDASEMAKKASRVVVMKPTIKLGKTVLVGFNAEVFEEVLG